MTPAERILTRVTVNDDGCWIWPRLGRDGYGRLTVAHQFFAAHRYSYEAFVGSIPDGYEVDHTCFNTACVNPSHLEAVTPTENRRRALLAGRFHRGPNAQLLTHCKRGHELTPDNRAGRQCRTCKAEWMKAHRTPGVPSIPDRRAHAGDVGSPGTELEFAL